MVRRAVPASGATRVLGEQVHGRGRLHYRGRAGFPPLHAAGRRPLRSPATCAITAARWSSSTHPLSRTARSGSRKPAAQEAAMTDFGTPGSFPTPPTPPSSGARTGPPWEQPGAFFQRWLDTAKSILLDPMNGFAQRAADRRARRAADLLRRRRRAGDPGLGAVPADRHRRLDDGRRRQRRPGGADRRRRHDRLPGRAGGRVPASASSSAPASCTWCCRCSAAPSTATRRRPRTFAYAYGSAVPIGDGADLRRRHRRHLGPGLRDHGPGQHAGDDAGQGGDRHLRAARPVLRR